MRIAVSLVVAAGAGSSVDIPARLVAERLDKRSTAGRPSAGVRAIFSEGR